MEHQLSKSAEPPRGGEARKARVPALPFIFLLLGLLAGWPGCKKRGSGESEAELARVRCASACASLSSCSSAEPALERQAHCLEACSSVRSNAARAGCTSAQDEALRCASTTRVDCKKLSSLRSSLEQGTGLEGCQADFTRLLRCTAPCREALVVRTGTRRLTVAAQELEVQAEQISLGCGPQTGALARKSPSGAPCEHVSVCTPARCPCPGSNAAYTARVCVDGRCATGERACELSPKAVGYEACKGR